MALFSLKSRIFRALGQNGVLWGQLELTLGELGLSCRFAEGGTGNQVLGPSCDTAAAL
jgi:hypothetical protein